MGAFVTCLAGSDNSGSSSCGSIMRLGIVCGTPQLAGDSPNAGDRDEKIVS